MNVLFIGPYRQSDGWGEAAKDFAHTLLHTKYGITIRPIYMSNSISQHIDDNLAEAEEKVYDDYDIVIQQCLPHYVDYNGQFKRNIASCFIETGNLVYNSWPHRLNTMDEIWISSHTEKRYLIDSGVKSPVKIVPIGINLDKFKVDRDPLDIPGIEDDDFVFYFIGEYIERKNLKALITAFHLEFHRNEPVQLVIKTGLGGLQPNSLAERIKKDINEIKATLRLYNTIDHYKVETVIFEKLTLKNLHRLHMRGNCFVMPSRGEAICRPLIDALGFGNPAIVTDNTGMMDNALGGIVRVPSHKTNVYTKNPPLPDLYTGYETWQEISVPKLQQAMRKQFSKGKRNLKNDEVQRYSYAHAAKTMEAILK